MTSLSKSKILLYRQCPKRLWLSIHRPDLIQISPATQARFDEGNTVGDIARRNYRDGVFVKTLNRSQALEQTKQAISQHQAVFEAAFYEDDVLIRADLLLPESQGYRLVEVKSSTGVKPYHQEDVTVQTWVMTKAGCRPKSVSLAYINNQFVYQGDGQYSGLFAEEDLTQEVNQNIDQVGEWVAEAKKILIEKEVPNITPGEQCTKPFTCDFYNYCNPPEEGVLYPVEILPYGAKKVNELRARGYKDLREVPAELLSDPRHLKVHSASVTGLPFFDVQARQEISKLPYPRYFLDFETIGMAVPIWKGTRPYMQIPFQWSCHVEHENGAMEHHEFLDISGKDPRLDFAKSLVATIGSSGSVVVYNAGFEGTRLNELAQTFPDLADALLSIKDRFFDLLPLARNYYYHPDMMGSWSIKQVLPTIAPELDYANLEVGDGQMAQDAYREAINSSTATARKEHLRQAMLQYCQQDTYAMVKIVQDWSK